MKLRSISSVNLASWLVAAVLALVPLQGFLTVWGSSLIGGYTALRLGDDALLLVLLTVTGVWLVRDAALRAWLANSLLVRLILLYAALSLLLGLVALLKGEVTAPALVYGLLVNLRFLAWFLAVLLVAQRSSFLGRWWPRLLLAPALLVVIFATLQYTILPHDFLAHFGYNAAQNIAPIETINHNSNYIRVQSTLRGANPLGAYLVVVLSALGVLFARGKRRLVCAAFGAVALFALYASGSRSAWIGAVASLAVVACFQLQTRRARLLVGGIALGAVVAAGSLLFALRGNVALQNHVLHTQKNSVVSVSSNDLHVDALENGIKDVWYQPLGAGPGTSGPASVHNTGHGTRLPENYYVQVAQETGWLGLALFAAILVLAAFELYQQARQSRLALAMFAALIGISFVGLLSHVWADDTLAFTWWGLAAVAIAVPPGKTAVAKIRQAA
ncbi:MAG TPA: O-antigen ligase family protein [Candidatus Saccharimonadales bacterium]|nr:O-antigen ligase family protein [Candidatus Saccharimonadales bacterium]